MSIIRESVEIGSVTVTLETGRLAKQAHGSILISINDTMLLVTVCSSADERAGIDLDRKSVV